jgi:hypothetical protein
LRQAVTIEHIGAKTTACDFQRKSSRTVELQRFPRLTASTRTPPGWWLTVWCCRNRRCCRTHQCRGWREFQSLKLASHL